FERRSWVSAGGRAWAGFRDSRESVPPPPVALPGRDPRDPDVYASRYPGESWKRLPTRADGEPATGPGPAGFPGSLARGAYRSAPNRASLRARNPSCVPAYEESL